MKTYGYCRISTGKQSIERQIRNILNSYPDAVIITDEYTGTKMDRPNWTKLLKILQDHDTIVFDSVSRMSRNAEEGITAYFDLYEKNINLIFLKEHYIDTQVYSESIQDRIAMTGSDEDEIFKGINNYFRKLAIRQIRIAFDQAQKEVDDLRQRTKEGIETAKLNGKQIGQTTGRKLNIAKKKSIKELMLKYSKSFNGTLSDKEVMAILATKDIEFINSQTHKQSSGKASISINTYYKYKKELKEMIPY